MEVYQVYDQNNLKRTAVYPYRSGAFKSKLRAKALVENITSAEAKAVLDLGGDFLVTGANNEEYFVSRAQVIAGEVF